jgi:type 1 fimbria pilin
MLAFDVPSSWAQEDQSITISTSKSTYGPGDTVILTGTVNGGTPGQLVAIQVKDARGSLILIRTVLSDQSNNFVLQFKVPLTASAGNLNITASARINGFVVTQNAVTAGTTSTVPEFPTSGLVLVGGIGLLLVFYRTLTDKRLGMKKFVV